jgi:hypothetical protein
MDTPDRTCSTPFEIPDDVLPILRRAADYGFELAGDPMGSWDENGNDRARLLNAARDGARFSEALDQDAVAVSPCRPRLKPG